MIKIKLAISLTAIVAVSVLAFPLGVVDAAGSFLEVRFASVETDSSELEKARIQTKGQIPTDGSSGAFGFGVISNAGLHAIAVTTTHGGVLDSEVQADVSDPVFHNHYVKLQLSSEGTTHCGTDLEVDEITWEQPGDVEIQGKKAIMEDVPYYFAGQNSLSLPDIVTFLADENVGAVVSFTIDPVDATGNTNVNDIKAICIRDVTPATNLIVRSVND